MGLVNVQMRRNGYFGGNRRRSVKAMGGHVVAAVGRKGRSTRLPARTNQSSRLPVISHGNWAI